MANAKDGNSPMDIAINIGYLVGANWEPHELPTKLRGTRARWRIHPDRSETGTCEDCQEYAGQFMALEEIVGLQPLHPNCVCSAELDPAQPGVGDPLEEFSVPPWSLQHRNPELLRRGFEIKRQNWRGERTCSCDGVEHTHG